MNKLNYTMKLMIHGFYKEIIKKPMIVLIRWLKIIATYMP